MTELAQITINGIEPQGGCLEIWRDGQGLLNWRVDTQASIEDTHTLFATVVTVEIQTVDSYRRGKAYMTYAGCACQPACVVLTGEGPLERGRVW
jgi:hypothetical protein